MMGNVARRVRKLNEQGYFRCLVMPSGEIAGLQQMVFTCGLFVGLSDYGYRTRFCYEREQEAIDALYSWDGRGDPPGPWIKEKPSERLGPGAVDTMTAPASTKD